MDGDVEVSVLKAGVGMIADIMRSEYKRWKEGKIQDKEEFKEANKKLRIAVGKGIVSMEEAKINLGEQIVYNARNLANNVTTISFILISVSEEIRGKLPEKVSDETRKLGRAFSSWQTELNVWKLKPPASYGENASLKENQKFRTYSPKEMLDTLSKFEESLDDLE